MIVTRKAVWDAEKHFRYKYRDGCYPPKCGQWFLKPSGKRGKFELIKAENDHKYSKPIIDERVVNYIVKMRLYYETV